ncbi:MAG: hypothetical protein WD942_04675 [Dehalococcoidia bacterium]
MTTEAGNEALRASYLELGTHLNSMDSQLVHGDSYHAQHGEFCKRAGQFAGYTNAAIDLADQRQFPQAFSLLRSALEHWAVDLVMMLGDRFVRHYNGSSEDELNDVTDRWHKGELTSVVDEPQLVGKGRSTLRLVHRGLTSEDGSMVLHPLLFEIDKFDPFFGSPDDQAQFADWLDPTRAREYAEEQGRRNNTFFRWAALVESLVLNSIVDSHHVIHLNVHYRFLSAFVHSHRAAHEQLAMTRLPGESPIEHTATELVRLYANQLAGTYTTAFIAMTKRPPPVGLDTEDVLASLVEACLDRSRHLWFLDDAPDIYDRAQQLLALAAEEGKFGTAMTVQDPMALGVNQIRYYRNPLDRLKRMHVSSTEVVTGITYLSPWNG